MLKIKTKYNSKKNFMEFNMKSRKTCTNEIFGAIKCLIRIIVENKNEIELNDIID